MEDAIDYYVPLQTQVVASKNMFFLLDTSGNPAGCGFYIAPSMAITVSHARLACVDRDGCINARTLDTEAPIDVRFSIAYDDGDDGYNKSLAGTNLDFMVLVDTQSRPTQTYFELTTLETPVTLRGSKRVAMLAASIALGNEMHPHFSACLSVGPAHVNTTSERHFAYQAAHDGDFGANLVFSKENAAAGMHIASVNRAKTLHQHTDAVANVSLGAIPEVEDAHERRKHLSRSITDIMSASTVPKPAPSAPSPKKKAKATTPDVFVAAVKTVSASVADIIESLNSGGVALFLGCREVREAIARVRLAVAGAGGAGAGGAGASPLAASGGS